MAFFYFFCRYKDKLERQKQKELSLYLEKKVKASLSIAFTGMKKPEDNQDDDDYKRSSTTKIEERMEEVYGMTPNEIKRNNEKIKQEEAFQ